MPIVCNSSTMRVLGSLDRQLFLKDNKMVLRKINRFKQQICLSHLIYYQKIAEEICGIDSLKSVHLQTRAAALHIRQAGKGWLCIMFKYHHNFRHAQSWSPILPLQAVQALHFISHCMLSQSHLALMVNIGWICILCFSILVI